MIHRKPFFYVLVWIVFLGMGVPGFAFTDLEFVAVWDPGNPEMPASKLDDGSTGYGSVDYIYNIAKYETTNTQYAEFLNAVASSDPNSLFNTKMGTTVWGGIKRSGKSGSYTYSTWPNFGNKPVNFVSWFNAARFANWLHNGRPTGVQDASTTEDGAYTFSGIETISERNLGAKYFLPTEHEWDKAAFYEPGAETPDGDGWWKYSSRVDVFPTPATVDEFGNVTNPGQTTANFRRQSNWNSNTIHGNVTTVGSAGSQTFFGAYDMTGNVFEWVLADPTKPDPNGWGPYTVRGGSFRNDGHVTMRERNLVHHDNHGLPGHDVGFRLASLYVEPNQFNPGDLNVDSFVDGADLLLWQESIGGNLAGDIDGDGKTDGSDFLIWQRNVTADGGSSSYTASVPEPSALLLGSAMVGMLYFRRLRNQVA